MLTLDEYRDQLLEELRADASIGATDTGDEFMTRALELLDESGELPEPTQIYFGKRGKNNRQMQLDGYAFDNADSSLCLIISDFEDSRDPEKLGQVQANSLSSRLINFLDEAVNGSLQKYCDDSDDIIRVAEILRLKFRNETDKILKVKLFLLSNKQLSIRMNKIKESSFNGVPVETHIWSIERFYDMKIACSSEPIKIDLAESFGSEGIPCIKAELGDGLDYDAYVAIIPGKLLADLYVEYGSKLLEGNVRAFLGASGSKSVNSGIRRTINQEPTRFFTYNNGIAVTAADVTIDYRSTGAYIIALEDMQIINGGQTTASLASAVLKKENTTLEGIYVPMKLTVIKDRDSIDKDENRVYDNMVQNIARFANSQNKVTQADFFSNHPFHIRMEQLSKHCLAPASGGNVYPTGWYYERSRGKYNQETVAETKSGREKFETKFPKKQIITKEKLAKYLNAVHMMPYEVSKGANKNIVAFAEWLTVQMKKNSAFVNEHFFKKCVCSAIIYESVDNLVKKATWYTAGGYKLNIVPYTISMMFSLIPKGYDINWQSIWQNQCLSPEMLDMLDIIAQRVNKFICMSNGVIVTEYCKHKETWESCQKALKMQLTEDFASTLVSIEETISDARTAEKEQTQAEAMRAEIMVARLGSAYWAGILSNPHAVSELTFKDKNILKVAADMERTGRIPSSAQAKAIIAIRTKLIDKGIIAE